MREKFEAAVIERMKESGFLEVEIRVECLGRHGEGYDDPSVDAYWHFWQAAAASVVVTLPDWEGAGDFHFSTPVMDRDAVIAAIKTAGGTVAT